MKVFTFETGRGDFRSAEIPKERYSELSFIFFVFVLYYYDFNGLANYFYVKFDPYSYEG